MLTITDTDPEAGGVLDFGGRSGINLSGSGTAFVLTGGVLQNVGVATTYKTVNCTANTTAEIKGGTIIGRVYSSASGSLVTISGGKLIADGTGQVVYGQSGGKVKIAGGEIIVDGNIINPSTPNAAVTVSSASSDGVALEITGGVITSKNTTIPVRIATNSAETVKIGGTAKITGEQSVGLEIWGTSSLLPANTAKIEIAGDVMISGATYGIYMRPANFDTVIVCPNISITGGYFAGGESYIPIMDTAYVTFPDSKVLNTQESAEKPGYYTLADKSALGGHNDETGADYAYQDLDGIAVGGYGNGLTQQLETAKVLYDTGNDNETYTDDKWDIFVSAYDAAVKVTKNSNANQTEIDFRTVNLVNAMQALLNTTDINVENLPNGTYSIGIQMYKVTLTGESMAAGALNGAATLTVSDNEITLSANFKPTYVSDLWGHLLQFWVYDFDTPAAAKAASESFNEDAIKIDPINDSRTEASYRNYYLHDGYTTNSDEVTYRKDKDNGNDGYSETYPYPGTVTFKMPYLGIGNDYSTIYCRIGVDVMRQISAANKSGDTNVLMILHWGTLKAIDINPTLSLNTDAVSLIEGDSQTVTATLLSAPNYAAPVWSSGDEAVATVDANGVITAVGAGTCIVTATSAKADADNLVKTVSVKVAAAGATPVKVESITKEGATVTATLSGDTLVTNNASGDGVEIGNTAVAFDAKSADAAGVTVSRAVIPASAAEALASKDLTVKTNMGDIKLTKGAVAQIADGLAGGNATLTVAKAEKPAGLSDEYIAFYEISLTDAAGASVAFDDGTAAITVPCGDAETRYAYRIEDGKRAEIKDVSWTNGAATWIVSHFSLWALSANGYAIDTGSEPDDGLAPGDYETDIKLWNFSANQASMGNGALAHDQSFIRVGNDGKAEAHLFFGPLTFTGLTGHLEKISLVTNIQRTETEASRTTTGRPRR